MKREHPVLAFSVSVVEVAICQYHRCGRWTRGCTALSAPWVILRLRQLAEYALSDIMLSFGIEKWHRWGTCSLPQLASC